MCAAQRQGMCDGSEKEAPVKIWDSLWRWRWYGLDVRGLDGQRLRITHWSFLGKVSVGSYLAWFKWWLSNRGTFS